MWSFSSTSYVMSRSQGGIREREREIRWVVSEGSINTGFCSIKRDLHPNVLKQFSLAHQLLFYRYFKEAIKVNRQLEQKPWHSIGDRPSSHTASKTRQLLGPLGLSSTAVVESQSKINKYTLALRFHVTSLGDVFAWVKRRLGLYNLWLRSSWYLFFTFCAGGPLVTQM